VKSFATRLEGFNTNAMVAGKCHVIAFVYDTETKEVLQVAEQKVIE
jgi:hypothetical protein